MAASLTPAEIRRALIAGEELALFDLREEDLYAQAHPLFAASLPLSRLELEIFDRVPRRDCRILLYDDDETLLAPAESLLARLGYSRVARLAGGLAGWRAAGFELFRDVNSASKAFGELVEARAHTPSVSATELQRRLERKDDLVVLDARRFEEYRTMSIPGGTSVPGAELVLRAATLAPRPETTIIVNCAGRTRSLIGAQSLKNAGLPNPVYALRNGTIGWTLAGQTLEHGQQRRFGAIDTGALRAAQQAARQVAYRAGVRQIAIDDLAALQGDPTRTLYRFDVRTPEEFAAGHLPGFRSAPGGQLVQETDVFAPVRGARLVLFDDHMVRADMTASWLAQMGWEVLVLAGVKADDLRQRGAWQPTLPPLPPVELIAADALAAWLQDAGRPAPLLLDLGPGPAFRQGHIAGAQFIIRSRLGRDLPAAARQRPIVLISADDRLARFAAADLAAAGVPAQVLQGGLAAWLPRPLERGGVPALSAFDDVYRRPYEGTDNAHAAMQAYLDWEYGLVAQLERDGTHGFTVLAPAPAAAPAVSGRGERLFYYAPGACSLSVHIALEEIGADYQAILVRTSENEQRGPAYLAINPRGRVPTLVESGQSLTECSAILSYLGVVHPGHGLLPLDDPFLTAKALEWFSWFSSTLHISFAQIWRGHRFTDEPAAQAALQQDGPARIAAHFRHVEASLAGGGPWLLGERYSAADGYALVFHRWASRLSLDMSPYPAWNAQAVRLYQRPAVQRALLAEGLEIPGLSAPLAAAG